MAKSKSTSTSKSTPIDKNQLVVDQLVALLESGVKPWARPWRSSQSELDYQNLVSRKSYSGMNPLLCIISNLTYGYESPFFLTFNQARQYGWKIKEGSKSCWIRFAKTGSIEVEDDSPDATDETTTKSFYYQKWSSVFNGSGVGAFADSVKSEPEAFFTALTHAQRACKLLIDLGTRSVPATPIETKTESKELQLA